MKVSILKEIVNTYTKRLGQLGHKWEPLYEYPFHWSTQDALDKDTIQKLLDTFKSEHTQRLWKRERYRPIETLKLFNEFAHNMSLDALNSLYNSQRTLDDRIDLFNFMAEEILNHLRKTNDHNNIADSHWDLQWVSLLISAKNPGELAFYHRDLFFKGAQTLEMKPQPLIDDYSRYTKMINIIFSFLKNSAIPEKRMREIKNAPPEVIEHPFKNVAVEALALYLKIDIFEAPR